MFKILIPDENHDTINDVDLSSLRKKGLNNILIDVDNTIVPWNSDKVSSNLRTWIKKSQDTGFELYLFSNNSHSRIKKLADILKISAIPKGGKPLTFAFRRALKYIDGSPEDTVMIGDQVFTDIWGGNLVGLYTILVNPISSKEFWGTKFNRFLEKLLAIRR
ncbi:MAG: YqeG family HAD IIIA-type phosphatase [Clostridiales bacterium]|nr:YqeG family HAD IIIA-type phosphatase [Clostridiales bacterium]